MQAESLNSWFVPQIFAILPVILQLALVLFLIGLNEFLWNVNRAIAIWVTVAVGLTLFFLFATTVLPSIQSLLLFVPLRIGQQPRSPCPYRSPQSWLFHRLISTAVRPFIVHVSRMPLDRYLKINSRNLTSAQGRSEWDAPIPRGTGVLFRNKAKDSWLEHGVAWLFQRDLEYMTATSPEETIENFSERPVPLYDATQALLEAKHAEFSHTTFTAVDHCFDIVLGANNIGRRKPYARFLHRLSLAQPLTFGLPPGLAPADPNVLQEDATLRLFSRNGGFTDLPPEAAPRTIEICLRLTAWMYGGKEARPCQTVRDLDLHLTTQSLPIQWVADILSSTTIDAQIVLGK
ncbi:hypothetical protein EST38_g8598 [Candolleomyces aberdarensis]|uniref:DUF6535 domain-containing protein n=1 Tax=Candolleomyces aberdarensis TaxID=2316362 RepID=A0A4Q2DC86_9AGAR|nr:hypothetical protein EST38_g8598 [Candolleomyces aberdarensis]